MARQPSHWIALLSLARTLSPGPSALANLRAELCDGSRMIKSGRSFGLGFQCEATQCLPALAICHAHVVLSHTGAGRLVLELAAKTTSVVLLGDCSATMSERVLLLHLFVYACSAAGSTRNDDRHRCRKRVSQSTLGYECSVSHERNYATRALIAGAATRGNVPPTRLCSPRERSSGQ